ncbi:hypothetical protein GCM10027435_17600 [Haloparvum alkalitolerans]|uniref:proteasome assembly chaperone family protein n=1 Tax=Haloparvum alkalitolerans TaxID=1042953 RepID=UPI003CE7E3F3
MSGTFRQSPAFEVSHDSTPSDVLLAGFSAYGLAGLTAVDYLVDHLDLEPTGHVRTEGLPTITPFTNGEPRHPTRLFSRPDLDVTVLVGELFVPVQLGEAFADAVIDWTEAEGVEEVAVLAGVPTAHAPDDHRTFYVATEDYRATRLTDGDVPPMGSGFLDGTNAALIERGIESPLGAAVYVTPVHAQVPDVEAAVRLVETVETVYDLDVDSGPLRAFAAEVEQHYAELAERMERRESDAPDDRMYM